jgi:deazaflavin-dependent oxidoreductase (nitroreductase family)
MVLLLSTTGRKSSATRTTPLIYQRHGGDYLVVASNGTGDRPGWFLPCDEFEAKPRPRDPVVVLESGYATEQPLDETTSNSLGAGHAARLDGPRTEP